jgi:TRAP-type mannitol/chloroaromatic compound transport system substrate-binding protein
VKVERFPESVIEALRKAADEVYAEQSAKDPMFKKVIDSYRAYSKQYDEYRKLNQLD